MKQLQHPEYRYKTLQEQLEDIDKKNDALIEKIIDDEIVDDAMRLIDENRALKRRHGDKNGLD